MNTCPGTDLLLLLDHDLIDDTDTQSDVTNHVESCSQCQHRRGQLSMVKLEARLPEAPFGFFQRINDQIEREKLEAEQDPKTLVHVRLQCTFCKDKLESKSSVYCGSCLAPYHKECFDEYGRCAVQGCEEKRFVQTQLTVPKPRRMWPFAVLALCGVAGGIAAYTSVSTDPGGARVAAPRIAKRAPIVSRYTDTIVDYDLSSSPTMAIATTKSGKSIDLLEEQRKNQFRIFDVKDLVGEDELSVFSSNLEEFPIEMIGDARQFIDVDGKKSWMAGYIKVLRTRRVTINFTGTPLTDVVAFLQDITGLNITRSREIKGELLVSLRLSNILLSDALSNILSQSGLTATLRNETLVVHKLTAAHNAWVDQFRQVRNARRAGFSYSASMNSKAIIDTIKRETGLKNWNKGAEISYDSLGILIAKNKPAVLNRVDKSLRALRLNKEAPGSQKFWFQGASSVVLSPSQIRIYDAVDLLDSTRVTLNFKDSTLKEIVAALNDLMKGELRFRLDPALASNQTQVSYAAENLSLADALTIVAKLSNTAYEVDRLGIYLKSHESPGLEVTLRRGSARLVGKDSENSELRRRLKSQRVDLNFDETPVEDCIGFLRDITGVNFVVSRDAQASIQRNKTKASIRLKGVALANAMDLILNSGGLSWRLHNGVIVIGPPSEKPVSSAFKRQIPGIRSLIFNKKPFVGRSLGDFARQLEKTTRLHVVFPDGVQSPVRITIPIGSSVGEALAHVESQADAITKFGDVGPQRIAFIAIKVFSKGPILEALERQAKPAPEKTSLDGLNRAIRIHRENIDKILEDFNSKEEQFQSSVNKSSLAKTLRSFVESLKIANTDTAFLTKLAAGYPAKKKKAIPTAEEGQQRYLKLLRQLKDRYHQKGADLQDLRVKWEAQKASFQKEMSSLQGKLRQLQKVDTTAMNPEPLRRHDKEMQSLKDKIDAARKTFNRQTKVHKLECARTESERASLKQRTIELDRTEYSHRSVIQLFNNEKKWRELLKTGFAQWRIEARKIADFQVRHRFDFNKDCPEPVPSKESCRCSQQK